MTKGRNESQLFNAQTPFIVLGEMLLDCQHGKDIDEAKKAKYKEKKENERRVRAHSRYFIHLTLFCIEALAHM